MSEPSLRVEVSQAVNTLNNVFPVSNRFFCEIGAPKKGELSIPIYLKKQPSDEDDDAENDDKLKPGQSAFFGCSFNLTIKHEFERCNNYFQFIEANDLATRDTANGGVVFIAVGSMYIASGTFSEILFKLTNESNRSLNLNEYFMGKIEMIHKILPLKQSF
jgi:hypothetical protein